VTDPGPWRLRPAEQDDRDFLASLFRSTRPELAMLPAGLAAPLLDQQQRLQEAGYRAAFPQARELIIECGGESAGRLLLAESPGEMRIVDVAVAPSLRGRGLATTVLRSLQAGARESGQQLVLSVAHDNTLARHLYLKLGFTEECRDAVRATMRWGADQ
jgi:ribosomal protein S18 acetylase RimI-like enzyme